MKSICLILGDQVESSLHAAIGSPGPTCIEHEPQTMNAQTITLALLAVVILGSDAWQDFLFFTQLKGSDPRLLLAAATRTVLLLLTILALIRPTRPLVVLAIITLLLALVRRAFFLLPSINPDLWPWVHSGLDLGWRVMVLAWAIDWLRKR